MLVATSDWLFLVICCLQVHLLTEQDRQAIKDYATTGEAVAQANFYDCTQERELRKPVTAALGLKDRLQVPDILTPSRFQRGVDAIWQEVEAFAVSGLDPKQEVKSWLNYICNEKTSEMLFSNGVRDKGRAGKDLDYFVMHPCATTANLSVAHVVALHPRLPPHQQPPPRQAAMC